MPKKEEPILQPFCSGAPHDDASTDNDSYFHSNADGKVLVAGGEDANFNVVASAELYDPASGSWTATGSLNSARRNYTATLLSNGKVLVAGGVGGSGNVLTDAELYDPVSETWTATGSLNNERYLHTATLLLDGKVLVTGALGLSPAALTSRAVITRRRCFRAAKCLLRQGLIAISTLS